MRTDTERTTHVWTRELQRLSDHEKLQLTEFIYFLFLIFCSKRLLIFLPQSSHEYSLAVT